MYYMVYCNVSVFKEKPERSEHPPVRGKEMFLLFFWCPCMAINGSVQYNGGLLPYIILLSTQCYYHRGTRLNAMKRFCILFAAYDPT